MAFPSLGIIATIKACLHIVASEVVTASSMDASSMDASFGLEVATHTSYSFMTEVDPSSKAAFRAVA